MTEEPKEFDEQALRRPVFYGGVPIRLSDGQEWYFPRPSVYLASAGPEDKLLWTLEGRGSPEGFAAECAARFHAVGSPSAEGDDPEVDGIVRVVWVYVCVLRQNYDLTEADAARLIYSDFVSRLDGEGSAEALEAIHAAVATDIRETLAKLGRAASTRWDLN